MPPTKLGQKLGAAASKAAAPEPTPLARMIAGGRRGEEVELRFLGAARIEIIGASDFLEVEAEVHREMRDREIERSVATSAVWELERARRTLARAVRDPADRGRPFGTVEEWGQLDPDVLAEAWHVYGDVRERLDPVAALTDDDLLQFELALKKKDAALWRAFGIAKLSAWLASSDVRPSTSPTPSSSSSGSEPES